MPQNFQNRFRNPFLNQREVPSGNTAPFRQGIHFTQPHELIMMKQEAARQAQAQEVPFEPPQMPINKPSQGAQMAGNMQQRQNQSLPPQSGPHFNNMQKRQNLNQPNSPVSPAQYYDPSVSFEPIDETTMNLIKAVTGKEPVSVPTEAQPSQPFHPAETGVSTNKHHNPTQLRQQQQNHPEVIPSGQIIVDPSMVKKFQDFAQNEMNASIFYLQLSKLAGEGKSTTFIKMSQRNIENSKHYAELAKNYGGGEFIPQTLDIVTPPQLRTGIGMALNEEINTLESLIDMLSVNNTDNKTVPLLQRFIFRKIEDLSRLQIIRDGL